MTTTAAYLKSAYLGLCLTNVDPHHVYGAISFLSPAGTQEEADYKPFLKPLLLKFPAKTTQAAAIADAVDEIHSIMSRYHRINPGLRVVVVVDAWEPIKIPPTLPPYLFITTPENSQKHRYSQQTTTAAWKVLTTPPNQPPVSTTFVSPPKPKSDFPAVLFQYDDGDTKLLITQTRPDQVIVENEDLRIPLKLFSTHGNQLQRNRINVPTQSPLFRSVTTVLKKFGVKLCSSGGNHKIPNGFTLTHLVQLDALQKGLITGTSKRIQILDPNKPITLDNLGRLKSAPRKPKVPIEQKETSPVITAQPSVSGTVTTVNTNLTTYQVTVTRTEVISIQAADIVHAAKQAQELPNTLKVIGISEA